MNKIGMCCVCGLSFSYRHTVIFQGYECCVACAEAIGYDPDDEEWHDDRELEGEWENEDRKE